MDGPEGLLAVRIDTTVCPPETWHALVRARSSACGADRAGGRLALSRSSDWVTTAWPAWKPPFPFLQSDPLTSEVSSGLVKGVSRTSGCRVMKQDVPTSRSRSRGGPPRAGAVTSGRIQNEAPFKMQIR